MKMWLEKPTVHCSKSLFIVQNHCSSSKLCASTPIGNSASTSVTPRPTAADSPTEGRSLRQRHLHRTTAAKAAPQPVSSSSAPATDHSAITFSSHNRSPTPAAVNPRRWQRLNQFHPLRAIIRSSSATAPVSSPSTVSHRQSSRTGRRQPPPSTDYNYPRLQQSRRAASNSNKGNSTKQLQHRRKELHRRRELRRN
uniref:Uncharacterized protein n=1 Tax=Populus alba TaxID=43335 RepID=A0A4U5QVR6_POPAL|nr:hypothetical protein D5086_0000036080 [Populus alba]